MAERTEEQRDQELRERIGRLRKRLAVAVDSADPVIIGVLRGILDLLADEL